MKRTIFQITLVILTAMTFSLSASADGKVLGAKHFDVPDWFKQSFLEISDDAMEAGDDDKHVLLFFHLEACPYCDTLLEENFRGDANKENIQSRFDAIDINIKGDREVVFNDELTLTEKDLAKRLGVQYTPTVMFITPDNKVALRLNGYRSRPEFQHALSYVSDSAYTKVKFDDYIQSQSTSPVYQLRPHNAFKDLQDLTTAGQSPLAVVFEDPTCIACDEFHDGLLQREDVSSVLKELTTVRLDTSSPAMITTVDGQKITAGEWAIALNLDVRPAVVLFDKGKEIIRIDALLRTWHFKGIVQWVAGRHYEEYPNMYQYISVLEKEALARGENVDYKD